MSGPAPAGAGVLLPGASLVRPELANIGFAGSLVRSLVTNKCEALRANKARRPSPRPGDDG